MEFAAVMLFIQKVFHLECLLLIRIISQPGVAYKSIVYKKSIQTYSSKNEEMRLSHEFVFVFIQYFIEAILSEKSCQKWGLWKMENMYLKRRGIIGDHNTRGGGGGGSCLKKLGFKPSTHDDIERVRVGALEP